jgi:hypothetical protein
MKKKTKKTVAKKNKCTANKTGAEYSEYLSRQSAHMAEKRSKDRDIRIPDVVDPVRRESCKKSLEKFLLTYLKKTFSKKFSHDHITIIDGLQERILNGDNLSIAADRGKGKSSLARAAALWAILYGHSRCVMLIAGTDRFAKQHINNLKANLQKNELLAEDFPEVCIPIIRLGNSSRKSDSQTVNGDFTYIKWTNEYIRFPEVKDSICSGSVIACFSIDGAVRGFNVEDLRPDLVLMDDIETRATVKSFDQTNERWRIIHEDCAGLAGQGQPLTMLFIGSIMAVDSIADRVTDNMVSPDWNGMRFKFLVKPPDNEQMWMKYIELRQDVYGAGPKAADKYFADNFDEMMKGAIASWDESYDPKKEKNAVQHYYNEWAKHGIGFIACEYQNDPAMAIAKDADLLTVADVISKVNAYPQFEVPETCTEITAFFDVHGAEKHIYYTVCGYSPDATAYVIDYGMWPDNKSRSLGDIYTGIPEVIIRNALEDITHKVVSRTYQTASKAEMHISRALVDSGWQTATVYDFCRSSKYGPLISPSAGEYSRGDFMDKAKKEGEKRGEYWRYRRVEGRPVRICQYDTVHWKKQVHGRVKAPFGQAGNISLWGSQGNIHRAYADHICAEFKETVDHKEYGEVEKWLVRPGHENHWFDCLVGCCVAASMQGISIPGMEVKKPRKVITNWGAQLKRQ